MVHLPGALLLMALTKTISADVLATLNMGSIKDDVYTLPPHRYSRERYLELAEVINNAGGKWNRKAKGFTFKGTAEAFKRALQSGETVNVQQVTQFFPTPDHIALRMAGLLTMKNWMKILEPSAGRGSLLGAINRRANHSGFSIETFAIEKDSDHVAHLQKEMAAALVFQADFLQRQLPAPGFFYDAVIMNPPFSKGDDIKHILRAWDFLKVGGQLVALCANGPKQNKMLKPWAESLGGTWEVLPAGTFADSGDKGTKIETVLLTANA